MSELSELQCRFLNRLVEGDDAIINDVAEIGSLNAEARLSIYANAYATRLKGVLSSDHEVLRQVLGASEFDHLAQCYVDHNRSTFTSLRHYADGLPDFLSSENPYRESPELAEIARFERVLLEAFDAADSPRVGMQALQETAPERWPTIRLEFHASVRTLTVKWASVETWRAAKQGQNIESVTALETPQTWLIWRGATRLSEFRSMEVSEQMMLQGFRDRQSFADVCEQLLDVLSEDQLSRVAFQHLSRWLDDGLVSELTTTVD